MRVATLAFVTVALVLQQCSAAPAPAPAADPAALADPDRPEIIEIIAPAAAAQETLDSLNLGEPNSEQSERSKRTIGILRQLFPNLSQIIDQKIQQIISIGFRTIGRSILTGVLGGGGNGATTSNAGGRVSVSLPAYTPDDDDDDDDDDDSAEDASSVSKSSTDRNEVQASNIEASESFTDITSTDGDSDSSTTTSVVTSTTTLNSSEEPSTVPATSAVNADENSLSGAESQQSEVRVQFTDNDSDAKKSDDDAKDDQDSAASGGNNAPIDDLSLDDADSSDDENRNKRFLSFGLGGGDGGSSGGSGGGSGNFLFDIIRRPAESIARTAGHLFRIVTGTDSLNLGITASHTASNASRLLVAGSGGTEQADEAHAAPVDGDVAKGDGYTEGIPGPVTRLFIIANRGIANLIQDLILRIAQTSERIVNFKARLITSII